MTKLTVTDADKHLHGGESVASDDAPGAGVGVDEEDPINARLQ